MATRLACVRSCFMLLLLVLTGLVWGQAIVEPSDGLLFQGEPGGPFTARFDTTVSEVASSSEIVASADSTASAAAHARLLADAEVIAQDRPSARSQATTRQLVRSTMRQPLLMVERSAGETTVYAASQLLIKWEEGRSQAVLERLLAKLGYRLGRPLLLPGWYRVEVPVDSRDLDFLDRARSALRAGGAARADRDHIVSIAATTNDTRFAELYGLHNTGQTGGTTDADIDAIEAWGLETGDSSIVVGVIDTGIDYNHPDLAANIWTNPGEIPGNGIDDDGNGFIDDIHGWDFSSNDNDPMDDNHHGTHVAGTIGAVGDNGRGVVGVAQQVRLAALKFLNSSGNGLISNAVDAIEYATRMGFPITNNSWTGTFADSSLQEAVTRAGQAGSLFVAAAGNRNNNIDSQPEYPAAFSDAHILSVAASDHNDALAGFSNYGSSRVDLAAPGNAILSTVPDDAYGYLNGTSMAAPHVAGAAVLVKARYPGLSALGIIDRLLGTVDQKADLDGNVKTGGRLNVRRALGTGAPDRFSLTWSGVSQVAWSSNHQADWFTLSPASGSLSPHTPVETTVQLSGAAALPAGNYEEWITFIINGQSIQRRVRLQIIGTVVVLPDSDFVTGGAPGGPFLPASRTYTIVNHLEDTVSFSITSDRPWLTLSRTSATLAFGDSQDVTIGLSANALAPGTYEGRVTFSNTTNGLGSRTLDIQLTVSSAGALYVTPASALEASGFPGGPFAPSSLTYSLQNVGGQTLAWSAGVSTDWVSLGVTSGSLAPGGTSNTTVQLNQRSTQLATGTYTTTVSFYQNGSVTQTREVRLTVKRPPELSVEPASAVGFSGLRGEPYLPAHHSWTVTNLGDASLAWSLSTSAAWLSLSVSTAPLAAGETRQVIAGWNSQALALEPGGYTATVTMENLTNGAGNTSREVHLDVQAPARLEVQSTDSYALRGHAETLPFPRQKTYICTNTSTMAFELAVTADVPWLDVSPSQVTLASGASQLVTISVTGTTAFAAGSYTGTVTFENLVNGVGDTDRVVEMSLSERAILAVYRLFAVGWQFSESGLERVVRRGHLVMDRESGTMTLVSNWRDHGEQVFQVQDWSHERLVRETTAGRGEDEHVTVAQLTGSADNPQRLQVQVLEGRVRPSWDIGGGIFSDLPLAYRGQWREIDRAGEVALAARITARLDHRLTRQLNDTGSSPEDAVQALANELLDLNVTQVPDEQPWDPVAAPDDQVSAEPVTVYLLRSYLIHEQDSGRDLQRRAGYLIVNRSTWEATLISTWWEEGQRWYQVQDEAVLFQQLGDDRRRSEQLLFASGVNNDAAGISLQWLDGYVRANYPVSASNRQDLPPFLRGEWWESRDGSQLGGRLLARIDRGLTSVYNLRNLDHQAAVLQIIDDLESNNWTRID